MLWPLSRGMIIKVRADGARSRDIPGDLQSKLARRSRDYQAPVTDVDG